VTIPGPGTPTHHARRRGERPRPLDTHRSVVTPPTRAPGPCPDHPCCLVLRCARWLALPAHLPHPAGPARPTPPLLRPNLPRRRAPQTPHVTTPQAGIYTTREEEKLKRILMQHRSVLYVIERAIAHFRTWQCMHTDYRRPSAPTLQPSAPSGDSTSSNCVWHKPPALSILRGQEFRRAPEAMSAPGFGHRTTTAEFGRGSMGMRQVGLPSYRIGQPASAPYRSCKRPTLLRSGVGSIANNESHPADR